MGLRVAFAVIATSFLLGILFTHWIADSLTLWQSPLTDDHLRTAAIYYSSFASLPAWMTWALVLVTAVGAVSLLASFQEGEAGNVMFDGASIFLYVCTVYVYWSSVVPSLSEVFSKPLPLTPSVDMPFPDSLRQPTIELASSHLICSVALTGVLILQAGRHWAEGEELSQRQTDEEEEARELRERGRRRHVQIEDSDGADPVVVAPVASPGVRKSVSARRTAARGGATAAAKAGSIGRAGGSRIRRMS